MVTASAKSAAERATCMMDEQEDRGLVTTIAARKGKFKSRSRDFDAMICFQVEPVGRWLLSHWRRQHVHRGESCREDGDGGDDAAEADSESSDNEEENADEQEVVFEDDIGYLRSLDPKAREIVFLENMFESSSCYFDDDFRR